MTTPTARFIHRRALITLALLLTCAFAAPRPARAAEAAKPAAKVLIVADEFPAMRVLADRLKAEERIESEIVAQDKMPASLAPYAAVLVYIHKGLNEEPEKAFIQYAEGGGKLILLHHSISSGKRKNKYWFKFFGVDLPTGDVDKGGYKWTEGITMSIVNLKPDHFITSNKIAWPSQIDWQPAGAAAVTKVPGETLHETEVYLNHVLTGERTILLGLKYTDAKTGKTYQQAHAGWVKPAGKGTLIYLLPGHSEREFKDPVYGRMVLNAVVYKP